MDLVKLTAGEASQKLKARLVGDPSFVIEGVASPQSAWANSVCFVEAESYLTQFHSSHSRCWVMNPLVFEKLDESARREKVFLLTQDPYHSFVSLVNLFYPTRGAQPRVHPMAFVDPSAQVDVTAQLEAFVSVGPGTQVGAGVVLHPGVWLGEDTVVGEGSVLYAGVKVYPRCHIGKRNIIHGGVVIGADGFGFLPGKTGLVKIPQVGRAILHDDVEVGANSCVDRGTLDDTVIGQGTKIDNLVQVGHNCKIGKNNILCGQAGLSGHTLTGDGVVIGGQTGTSGHLKIGDGAQVGGQSGVINDVAPDTKVKGYPLRPVNEYLKIQVLIGRLPEIYKRLLRLEDKLGSKNEGRD